MVFSGYPIDERSRSDEQVLSDVELVKRTAVMTPYESKVQQDSQYRWLADPSNKVHVAQLATVLMGSAKRRCVRFLLDPILEIDLDPQ